MLTSTASPRVAVRFAPGRHPSDTDSRNSRRAETLAITRRLRRREGASTRPVMMALKSSRAWLTRVRDLGHRARSSNLSRRVRRLRPCTGCCGGAAEEARSSASCAIASSSSASAPLESSETRSSSSTLESSVSPSYSRPVVATECPPCICAMNASSASALSSALETHLAKLSDFRKEKPEASNAK